jgi:hypothetical protein
MIEHDCSANPSLPLPVPMVGRTNVHEGLVLQFSKRMWRLQIILL